ncbi:MAG TPA: YXWGXW repeat-containing protein [Gemmatimonadaceae bacterium]|jgi:hypothetical protein|nr:YXWGXW repeat-containing protein [Gemmatimonadaceae bacterium]
MRNTVIRVLPMMLTTITLAACGSAGYPPPDEYVTTSAAVDVAPPDLPAYSQPPCPGDGYLWTPGYWAWADGSYYWVPGAWVEPPQPGFLWTPGYWGWGGSAFVFHEGYWGEHVGFYGGVAYGFGYSGHGYDGGRWDGGHFFYNRSVTNVNVTVVHNVYNSTTIVNNNVTRVSYNGGRGGITARATADEDAAAQARHVGPVAAQTEQGRLARANSPSRAAVHPNDLPRTEHATPNTGDPNLDQRYKSEQDQLAGKQAQERQDLQQRQQQEHQRLSQQNAAPAKVQQLEQRHQQQTQALAAKHARQTQTLKARQQPPRKNR